MSQEIVDTKVIRKIEGRAAAARLEYANNNLRLAAHYWCQLYEVVRKNHVKLTDYFLVMAKFSDREVYEITDYLKK